MCSTPSMPAVQQAPTQTVATPTYADAATSKASTATRNKAASYAQRNISTSARGLLEDAETEKKGLLGE